MRRSAAVLESTGKSSPNAEHDDINPAAMLLICPLTQVLRRNPNPPCALAVGGVYSASVWSNFEPFEINPAPWLADKTCKTLILLSVGLALAKPNETPVTVGFRNLNPTYKSNFCQSVTPAPDVASDH